MALREIITVPDPVLKNVSDPVSGLDADTKRLLDDMLETMYAAPGIGLAAIQIGVPKRLVVLDVSGKDEPNAPRFLVNPEIIAVSDEMQVYEEGCLSIPDVYDEVERPARVQVRYQDYAGETVEEWADGLYAVCVQHEIDHLNGVLFIDHLSRLKRERAVKKVVKAKLEQSRSAL